MSKDVHQYYQFEPQAFLADVDFMMMSAEARGVYISLILYLYCNGGELKMPTENITVLYQCYGSVNNSVISQLSNCHKNGADFIEIWGQMAHKFVIVDGVLTHKRVTAEVLKVKEFREKKSRAGKKGMQKRWGKSITSRNTVITKISKDLSGDAPLRGATQMDKSETDRVTLERIRQLESEREKQNAK